MYIYIYICMYILIVYIYIYHTHMPHDFWWFRSLLVHRLNLIFPANDQYSCFEDTGNFSQSTNILRHLHGSHWFFPGVHPLFHQFFRWKRGQKAHRGDCRGLAEKSSCQAAWTGQKCQLILVSKRQLDRKNKHLPSYPVYTSRKSVCLYILYLCLHV